jgi:excisionase family DNA binding protein
MSICFPDEILTSTEAAALMRVHRSTLLRECKAGRVPYRRLGRRFLFSRQALDEWMRAAPSAGTTSLPDRPDPKTVANRPDSEHASDQSHPPLHPQPITIRSTHDDVVSRCAADVAAIISTQEDD